MRRRRLWLGIAGLVLLGRAVRVLVWDWNGFKGPIERQVEARTGREFEIDGNLDVDPGWTPVIRADVLRFGNADWSKVRTMAEASRLEFSIALKPDRKSTRLNSSH